MKDLDKLEVGYDVPARLGEPISGIATPALIIDLDAFDRNIARMKDFLGRTGLRLRAHAKTHKSADIARIQMERGGACGICCQKVSEAEALVRAGIRDVLISNEVWGRPRIERLVSLARRASISVCVDNLSTITELSEEARRQGQTIGVLVEINCGANRCGVAPGEEAVTLARAIAAAPCLRFEGLQAYQGQLQHISDPTERREQVEASAALTRMTMTRLAAAGFDCRVIGGAGTGSFAMDAELDVINELQCGSYIFMDADYDRIRAPDGGKVGGMENALFVLTTIMSASIPGRPVCDAGHKAHAIDSGLPQVDLTAVRYVEASDEHGVLDDPERKLKFGDQIRLIPGHCDPTCNLHDWFVGVRNGIVETLWPVTARGKLF